MRNYDGIRSPGLTPISEARQFDGSPTAAVPEPATALLVLSGIAQPCTEGDALE